MFDIEDKFDRYEYVTSLLLKIESDWEYQLAVFNDKICRSTDSGLWNKYRDEMPVMKDIEKLFAFFMTHFNIYAIDKQEAKKHVLDIHIQKTDRDTLIGMPESCVPFYILRYMLQTKRMRLSSASPSQTPSLFPLLEVGNVILLA